MNELGTTAKISAVATAVVAAAVALAFVLVRAQAVFLALLSAIVIAEALRPLVDAVTARVPRGAAIGIVFVAVFAAGALLWWIPLRALIPQALALWSAVPGVIAMLAPRLPSSPGPALLNALGTGGQGIAQSVGQVGLAFVMALFWFGASASLRNVSLAVAQPQRRAELDALFAELGAKLRLFVVGSLINGVIVGIACTVGFAWMRFPYPLVLGVLEGLLVAIPYIGPLIGVLLAGGVALALQGPSGAVAGIAVASLAHGLEGSLVAPLIFQSRLNVDPLAILVATAIGGTFFGIAGVILAVPAIAVAQTLIERELIPALRT